MKIRIGSFNDRYWVEGKHGLIWHRLPSINFWIGNHYSRFDKEYIEYFETFEDAHKSAQEYLMRFSNKVAAYTKIK